MPRGQGRHLAISHSFHWAACKGRVTDANLRLNSSCRPSRDTPHKVSVPHAHKPWLAPALFDLIMAQGIRLHVNLCVLRILAVSSCSSYSLPVLCLALHVLSGNVTCGWLFLGTWTPLDGFYNSAHVAIIPSWHALHLNPSTWASNPAGSQADRDSTLGKQGWRLVNSPALGRGQVPAEVASGGGFRHYTRPSPLV